MWDLIVQFLNTFPPETMFLVLVAVAVTVLALFNLIIDLARSNRK